MKSLRNPLGLLAVLAALAACEQIIGLEDRTLVDGGGPSQEDTKLCKDYCGNVMDACLPPSFDAYTSEKNCLSMCSFMPQGSTSDTAKNTAGCRAHYASLATDAEGADKYCPAAAPGGGSPADDPKCGEICESYCGLFNSVCSDVKKPNCLAKCRALPDRGKYSARTDYENTNDTIQCRVAHLTAAAQAARDKDDDERTTHCGHASLRASLGDRAFCDLPNETVPSCTDYCKLVMQTCGMRLYESQKQCENFCENGLIKGTNTTAVTTKNDKGEDVTTHPQDSTKDTLACRRWHAYYAFDNANPGDTETHCPHASPTGDGHCGETICKVYCPMLERGCKDKFKTEFPGGQDACVMSCKGLRNVQDSGMGYDLVGSEDTKTDTLQCRFRYLVDVFNSMPAACEKAFPKGTCSR